MVNVIKRLTVEVGYRLFVEQVATAPIELWTARLFGPLGDHLASWHLGDDPGALVDNAADYLYSVGQREAAVGLRKNWREKQGERTQGGQL